MKFKRLSDNRFELDRDISPLMDATNEAVSRALNVEIGDGLPVSISIRQLVLYKIASEFVTLESVVKGIPYTVFIKHNGEMLEANIAQLPNGDTVYAIN
jgi:hypothetical protein